MNLQIIITLLLTILGLFTKNPTPARLGKKESWSKRNYGLIMTILFSILILLLMGLFVTICFAISGNTEANMYYYHLNA